MTLPYSCEILAIQASKRWVKANRFKDANSVPNNYSRARIIGVRLWAFGGDALQAESWPMPPFGATHGTDGSPSFRFSFWPR